MTSIWRSLTLQMEPNLDFITSMVKHLSTSVDSATGQNTQGLASKCDITGNNLFVVKINKPVCHHFQHWPGVWKISLDIVLHAYILNMGILLYELILLGFCITLIMKCEIYLFTLLYCKNKRNVISPFAWKEQEPSFDMCHINITRFPSNCFYNK